MNTTDAEMSTLFAAYGTVVSTLVVGQKRTAFVQMGSVEEASNAVEKTSAQAPTVGGQTVRVQFSRRTEITPNVRYPGNVSGGQSGGQSGGEGTVLLVTILNYQIPVSLDNLFMVFRSWGDVLRIVTFEKKAFQALIEFASASQAQAAMGQLEGKEIFQGCNLLKISPSRTSAPLRIVENNHRARDFTLSQFTQQAPPTPYSQNPYANEPQPYAASNPYSSGPPQHGFATPSQPKFGGGAPMQGGVAGCVLLVNGLTEDVVTADILFAIFGVYGDVMRVKILWKNKSMAMIEMATPDQAARARRYLDGVELYGQALSINTSKHSQVKVPRQGGNSKFEPSNLTKDFSSSTMHRFKRAGSKNERHICAPSAGLHVSNLPEDVTPEEIHGIFQELKLVNEPYIFGTGTKKMAIVQTSSIGDAIHSLITLHGSDFQGNVIRMSFSHPRPARKQAPVV